MHRVNVTRSVSMGHRLPSYIGLCSSFHGHNIKVEVDVQVQSDEFLDFKILDEAVENILEPLDHALVMHDADPLVDGIRKLFPAQRVVLLNVEPTSENLAEYIMGRMGTTYNVAKVVVYETDKYCAICTKYENRVVRVG